MSLSVIASSSLSPGLRGALTKWYLEVMPGIFVATVTVRVRDELWSEVETWITTAGSPGFAALIHLAPTEQGYTIRTAGENRYETIDFDGLTLIARKHENSSQTNDQTVADDPDEWGS